MRSATLLLIRMKAAETSASSAIADCTPLTVVSRSSTTAEIETFMSDVSTTRTNIAAASSTANRELGGACSGTGMLASLVTGPPSAASEQVLALPPAPSSLWHRGASPRGDGQRARHRGDGPAPARGRTARGRGHLRQVRAYAARGARLDTGRTPGTRTS